MAGKTFVAKIISDFDNRGVGKAQKQFGALHKTTLALGAAFTAATALAVKFGKESVQAAIEDQKAQALLTKTLENGGWGKAAGEVADWIDATQRATGVADDQLRPAYTTLFNALGDATAAQQMLNIAMDVSAGTGKDLSTVASAMSKATLGSNTALMKLGTGLDKATMKNADLATVMDLLAAKFSGQAATAADTFQGKLDRLNVAADEAKETIGTSLINAFIQLAGSGDIDRAAAAIGEWADKVSGWIQTAAGWLEDFKIGWAWLTGGDLAAQAVMFGKMTDAEAARRKQVKGLTGWYDKIADQQKLDLVLKERQKKLEAEAAKKAKEKAAAEAKALRLKQLAYKFDLQAINIEAAKKRTKSADTLSRLDALAIIAKDSAGLDVSDAAVKAATAQMTNVTVNVAGSVVTEQQLSTNLAQTLAAALQRNGGMSGYGSVLAAMGAR